MRQRNGLISLCILLAGCGSEGAYPAQCGAPLPGWRKPNDGYSVLAIVNHVSVKHDGKLAWNGKEISVEQLGRYSSMIPQMNPTPFTLLEIESGASCALVTKVRKTIDERAKCEEDGWRRCGEGNDPWARIGDVIGPNGEIYKYFPNRVQPIEPTAEGRAKRRAIGDEADAIPTQIASRNKSVH